MDDLKMQKQTLKKAYKKTKRKHITPWKILAIICAVVMIVSIPLSILLQKFDNTMAARFGGSFWKLQNEDANAQYYTSDFNSAEETFEEFIHRLREDPGHRWDHWWIAEILDGDGGQPEPAGALVGTVSKSDTGPDGSYISYLGVLESARGRGVAKGLLKGIVSDAAERGYDRVGLEVDADSPTGADALYVGMGWKTRYVTESWHLDVDV